MGLHQTKKLLHGKKKKKERKEKIKQIKKRNQSKTKQINKTKGQPDIFLAWFPRPCGLSFAPFSLAGGSAGFSPSSGP